MIKHSWKRNNVQPCFVGLTAGWPLHGSRANGKIYPNWKGTEETSYPSLSWRNCVIHTLLLQAGPPHVKPVRCIFLVERSLPQLWTGTWVCMPVSLVTKEIVTVFFHASASLWVSLSLLYWPSIHTNTRTWLVLQTINTHNGTAWETQNS